MFAECVRLTADALADATIGVNAMLALVPRFAGDGLPTSLTVVDELRNEAAALNTVPASLPALVVSLEAFTVVSETSATDQGDGRCTLIARIVTASDVDAIDAKRTAGYYLRALTWSLRKFNRRDGNDASRYQNGVSLWSLGTLEPFPMYQPTDDTVTIAACRIPWTLRDASSF